MTNDLDQKKVVLGLSGGVDSAVAAYLLKENGYEVFGVYLKNWTELDEKGVCPALRDREDAMRAAAKLGITFMTVDYERQYRERVFAPFLKGMGEGINPNPDVLCNPLVKFEALLAVADEIRAAWIATGHYARHIDGKLLAGLDKEKDQSYFLSRITSEQLERSIFPIGDYTKPQVRALAEKIGLHLARKDGTSGICFIGERNFENFMRGRVESSCGPVVTPDGKVIGEHRGLPFYTIGQRHGFGIGGGDPYYVAQKRMADNALVVAQAYDPALFSPKAAAFGAHWIGSEPNYPLECLVRLRYRQALQSCKVLKTGEGELEIIFAEPQKAVAPGQYAVFYDGDACLGSAELK
jgi:tRNA-uridine 2-sulfurtransferase